MEKSLGERAINPRDLKMRLGREIVAQFHSEEAALEAEEEFVRVFQREGVPRELPTLVLEREMIAPIELLMKSGLVGSRSEARRLVDQGGVKLDGEQVNGLQPIQIEDGAVLRVGKRRFVRLSLEESKPGH